MSAFTHICVCHTRRCPPHQEDNPVRVSHLCGSPSTKVAFPLPKNTDFPPLPGGRTTMRQKTPHSLNHQRLLLPSIHHRPTGQQASHTIALRIVSSKRTYLAMAAGNLPSAIKSNVPYSLASPYQQPQRNTTLRPQSAKTRVSCQQLRCYRTFSVPHRLWFQQWIFSPPEARGLSAFDP